MAFVHTKESRKLLAISLRQSRGIFSRKTGRRYPVCPFCNKSLVDPGDLHEALISRGQLRGHKDLDLIYSRYNCIERHHNSSGCNHGGGIGGDESFRKAALYLASWEGESQVRTWLERMALIFPQIGKEALRRFNSVMEEEFI